MANNNNIVFEYSLISKTRRVMEYLYLRIFGIWYSLFIINHIDETRVLNLSVPVFQIFIN